MQSLNRCCRRTTCRITTTCNAQLSASLPAIRGRYETFVLGYPLTLAPPAPDRQALRRHRPAFGYCPASWCRKASGGSSRPPGSWVRSRVCTDIVARQMVNLCLWAALTFNLRLLTGRFCTLVEVQPSTSVGWLTPFPPITHMQLVPWRYTPSILVHAACIREPVANVTRMCPLDGAIQEGSVRATKRAPMHLFSRFRPLMTIQTGSARWYKPGERRYHARTLVSNMCHCTTCRMKWTAGCIGNDSRKLYVPSINPWQEWAAFGVPACGGGWQPGT